MRPLTVLIGTNNTGKSAFLDAVRALSRDVRLAPSDHWRMYTRARLEIRAQSEQLPNLHVTREEVEGKPELKGAQRLDGVAFFRLPSSGIVCRDKGVPAAVKDLPLGDEGQHLASVLDYMLRKDRRRFDGVVATLRDLVPGFENLVINTPDAESRSLGAVLDNGLELPGELLSVGLRHLIFFITLAHHPTAPQVILIEEPELGVHPRRLGDIVSLLRSIAQGEFCDHPAQVILTTHSPFLLDHLNLEQDQLLIFKREDDLNGARNAYPADKERLQIFLDEFLLGEVWYNEREEGLIGQP